MLTGARVGLAPTVLWVFGRSWLAAGVIYRSDVDWRMVRLGGVGGLVVAVALLAVVPITYGLISPQPTESPTSWCGTWLFRTDARACPSCCATAGAYERRLDVAVLIGVVAALVVGVALFGERLAARSRPG